MSGLKKTALAIAIATLPFAANAELQLLNDSAMGELTGQSGITIELETKVSIGEFVYTDEGSLSVNDITIGGAGNGTHRFFAREDGTGGLNLNTTDLIDGIAFEIDVTNAGDMVISGQPTGVGGVVDFKITTGDILLRSQDGFNESVLSSGISMLGLAGGLTIRATNEATPKLKVDVSFAIEDLDFELDFLSAGIKDMSITADDFDPDSGLAANALTTLSLELYAKDNAQGVESLGLDINNFTADIAIGAVEIGGVSIGSVHINDLAIIDTHLVVYGH